MDKRHSLEMRAIEADPETPSKNRRDSRNRSSSNHSDRAVLAQIGKTQVLRRNFGFLSMLGFSCTLMGTWAGLLAFSIQALINGGSAGSVYGFIFVWLGIGCICACLGELASMAPTSGGQYHYTAMLAPESCQRFLSYIAGWVTVIAWQATVAGVIYPASTMLQGLIVMNNVYVIETWHTSLICYAFLLLALFINTYLSKQLPKLEGAILVFYIIGFFGVIIPLASLGDHVTADAVFTVWNNQGGYPTQGLSWFIGLSTFAGAFAGVDGAMHMSEEIQNASVIVPRCMLAAVLVNGSFGFAMLMGLLFSLNDLEQALASPTGYPYMAVFQAAAGIKGATLMTCCIIILNTFGTWAALATASRQMWAFARDNGLPFSRYLARVEPRIKLPLYSIALTVITDILLQLIGIGSSTALYAVISLLVSSFYLSFLIPCALLLWRRLNGSISSHHIASESLETKNIKGGKNLVWGPWRMPYILGVVVNTFAVIYSTIIFIFSYWPQIIPVTPQSMNYSVLVSGAVILFSFVYYFLRARKIYVGPIVETGSLNLQINHG